MANGPALDFFGAIFKILFFLVIPGALVRFQITEYKRETKDLLGFPDSERESTKKSNIRFLWFLIVSYIAIIIYFYG